MKSKLRTTFWLSALLIVVPGLCVAAFWRASSLARPVIWLLPLLFLPCFGLWNLYRRLLLPVLNLNETVSTILGSTELQAEDLNGASLLEQFQRLVEQEYSARISTREAELDALQSQINPHFLYNTLECIRGQATIEGADAIAEMSKGLAEFFRYSISRREKQVTLADEIANIDNYLKIMNYRFGNKYVLRIHMDEEEDLLRQTPMPKLTLQPIVENALLHGVRNSEREVEFLDLSVEMTEARILLRVTDYGDGIPQEKLDRINAELRDSNTEPDPSVRRTGSGIALRNINERIQLSYGRDYGLRVFSTVGMGCAVEVILPRARQFPPSESPKS